MRKLSLYFRDLVVKCSSYPISFSICAIWLEYHACNVSLLYIRLSFPPTFAMTPPSTILTLLAASSLVDLRYEIVRLHKNDSDSCYFMPINTDFVGWCWSDWPQDHRRHVRWLGCSRRRYVCIVVQFVACFGLLWDDLFIMWFSRSSNSICRCLQW